MRGLRFGAVLAAVAVMGAWAPAAQAQQAEPLRWVALGDAYTAGGIDAAGTELLIGGARDGCGRTSGSYPEVLRTRLSGRYELTNVSCAGASVANVTYLPRFPPGHLIPFFEVFDPVFPFPPVPRQLDAVTADTDLVTVGVGGNTLGFVELVFACLQLGEWADPATDHPCTDYFSFGWDGIPTITDRLSLPAAEYDGMLAMIRAAAPRATILAVGYPTIFPTDPTTCDHGFTPAGLRHFGTVSYPDLAWLRTQVVEQMNQVIADSAARQGIRFIDLYPTSADHDVCQSDNGNWVEGVVDHAGRWAMVRPDTNGHNNTANAIEAALP
ncbi:SGNH/GDSL hydrolase family protein [Actinokineospora globicatena]|uniref:SGNH/GDSL hydrolase family protein n=1 Tax=Actinokineospora globicatena TaxID=103729 RepID=UPI0020A522FC|nr:SGNH/GDSL hydrolase family protein [Actinokineospora globicatena]MCP2303770.1 GDSL-like Lipase/Acylhydrolase family protein [Actinokineospora globicatena]GLW79080.1 lipase [Actinokineospora globicatena]GLW86510.1 lipase [Actinokineospora globicatena]